jgi:cell division protein FtsB
LEVGLYNQMIVIIKGYVVVNVIVTEMLSILQRHTVSQTAGKHVCRNQSLQKTERKGQIQKVTFSVSKIQSP